MLIKMEYILRRGKLADVNQIYSLGAKTQELRFSQVTKFFHLKDEIEEWIKKPNDNILLVAAKDKKVVGFIYAKIIGKHWCMIDNLVVAPEHRGEHIGTVLLEELLKILRQKKIDYVQTLEQIKNKKGRKFWKKKGFHEGYVFVWANKKLRV